MSAPAVTRSEQVSVIVLRELDEIDGELNQAFGMRCTTDADNAARSATLAPLFARLERCWTTLFEASGRSDTGVSRLLGLAALAAAGSAGNDERFWRENAVYSEARARGADHDAAQRAVLTASRARRASR